MTAENNPTDFEVLMLFAAVLSLPVGGMIVCGVVLLVNKLRSRNETER